MQSPAPPKEWLLTGKALSNLYGQAEKHSWALNSSLVPLLWVMQDFLNMWGSTVAWVITNSSTINSKMPVFCTLHTLSLPSEMAESFLNPARRSEIVQAIYCWSNTSFPVWDIASPFVDKFAENDLTHMWLIQWH